MLFIAELFSKFFTGLLTSQIELINLSLEHLNMPLGLLQLPVRLHVLLLQILKPGEESAVLFLQLLVPGLVLALHL